MGAFQWAAVATAVRVPASARTSNWVRGSCAAAGRRGAGPPGEPPGAADGRPSHQHRHLAGAALARRRAAARADSAHPLGTLLRTVRQRGRHRGPGAARGAPVTLGVRCRHAVGGPADRLPAQRVLAQRPDARAARIPRYLTGAGRRSDAHRTDAALAGTHTRGRARRRGARGSLAAPVQAFRARARTPGVHHRDVPPVGRAVRRRTAPQGGGRPAPRGHRPAPGAAARGHLEAPVPLRGRTGRAGRVDELRRGAPAHCAEVLRPRPARRQGGRGQAARLVHPVLHEPPDDPSGPPRGRVGTGPSRAVRQP